jgi:dTDP-4-dehydrorhamnose reductase
LCEPLRRLALCGKYGTYHLTNSGQCTWFELAQETIRLLGAACEVRPIAAAELNLPAPRPAFSVLENRSYRRLTRGVLRPWPDALKEYLGGAETS